MFPAAKEEQSARGAEFSLGKQPRSRRTSRSLYRNAALVLIGSLLLLLLHGPRTYPTLKPTSDALYRAIEQQFIVGELAEAEAESRHATALTQQDAAWAAKFRLLHARILLYQGHSAEALKLLTPPLPVAIRDRELAAARNSLLALAYDRTGDLAHAQQALDQAKNDCPDERSRASVRLAEGVIDGENGRLAQAERDFELSLASARGIGDQFLQTQALLNLGVGALRQEHYDDALDRFRQASTVASRIGARLAMEKATGNAGWAFYKLGDYRRALENSRVAEREAASLGASLDQVEWLNNAGLMQFRLGDLGAARFSYQQSYQLALSLKNDEEIGDSLLALAYLSLAQGDLPEALSKSREVERIAAETGDPEDALEPSLIEAVALGRQRQTLAAREKLLALEKTTSTGEAGESVRWETENALAGLSPDPREADLWYQRAIATFRHQRSSLSSIDSRLPFFENGSSLYLGYMEQLIREGKPDAALAVLDQSRAETLAEGLGVSVSSSRRGLNAQALARRLDGTILVYCLRPGTSYLWAIGPQRIGFFRIPGKEVILPLAAAHTQAILAARDVLAQPNAPGAALYRDLVAPAAGVIAPHSRVFVIADESLSALNFETLIAPAPQPHLWIEDADLINARSISLLAASHHQWQPGRGSGRLLLVGDPVYDRPDDVKLAHAAEEVARVAGHFAPDRRLVLTGAAATPLNYRHSHPEGFAYIHFVAHASASEIDPLDSSVILSAPPGEDGAYKLYARSILDQRLSADLVTISACYGSGVRSYSGEGLVGLAWAFLHTGSHQVIGALWEVSDASTPQLMSDLYDSLDRGSRPDVALRQAKLAMIHRGGVFRKPFYWGAFQLYSGA